MNKLSFNLYTDISNSHLRNSGCAERDAGYADRRGGEGNLEERLPRRCVCDGAVVDEDGVLLRHAVPGVSGVA